MVSVSVSELLRPSRKDQIDFISMDRCRYKESCSLFEKFAFSTCLSDHVYMAHIEEMNLVLFIFMLYVLPKKMAGLLVGFY